MAITLQPDMLMRIASMEKDAGDSPYTFGAKFCLAGVRRCLDRKRVDGEYAYFFESGHRSFAEANDLMNRLYNNAKTRKAHRYSSHTFIGKNKSTPLQAADLLAWQWYTDMRRRLRGEDTMRPGARMLWKARGAATTDCSMVMRL